jgi:hypothetical protein
MQYYNKNIGYVMYRIKPGYNESMHTETLGEEDLIHTITPRPRRQLFLLPLLRSFRLPLLPLLALLRCIIAISILTPKASPKDLSYVECEDGHNGKPFGESV